MNIAEAFINRHHAMQAGISAKEWQAMHDMKAQLAKGVGIRNPGTLVDLRKDVA